MNHLITLNDLKNSGLELLIFSASWCLPCKATKPAMEKLSTQHPVSIYEVDGESRPDLMRQFHVRSFPTLVLLKDGQPVGSISGGQTLGQLHNFVGPYL